MTLSKRTRFVIALVLAAVLTLSVVAVAGCTRDVLASVTKKGVIRVGTSADYPPFEFVDDQGNYAGFDVDLMEAIAGRLGVAVEWHDMDFNLLLAALKKRRIDAVIACMDATEERAKEALFTIPYLVAPDAILVKKGSTLVITDLVTDLPGLKVGVQTGTVHYDWIKDNLIDPGLMPETNLSQYPRADMAVLDLVAGRLDCVFMDESAAIGFTQTHDVEKALSVDLEGAPAIAVALKQEPLLEKLNEIIQQLEAEGVIDQLAQKWSVGAYAQPEAEDEEAGD